MGALKPIKVEDSLLRWPAERREVVREGTAAGEQDAFRQLAAALGEAAAGMRPDDISCSIDREPDGSCRFRFRAYRR
jgi:hypothetical protein